MSITVAFVHRKRDDSYRTLYFYVYTVFSHRTVYLYSIQYVYIYIYTQEQIINDK